MIAYGGGLQVPPAVQAEASVSRELKKDQKHRFRVHLESAVNDEPETLDYEFDTVDGGDVVEGSSTVIEFKAGAYVLRAAGRVIRKKLVGAGKLSIGALGLPTMLGDALQNPHFWYPMLSLYVPPEVKGGTFPVNETLGLRTALVGTGSIQGGVYEMSCDLKGAGAQGSKVHLKWSLDAHGWPKHARGEVTGAGAETRFSVDRA